MIIIQKWYLQVKKGIKKFKIFLLQLFLGKCMDNLWILFGLSISNPCNICIHGTDTQIIHKLSTDYPQIIHRLSTDYPQIIHGYPPRTEVLDYFCVFLGFLGFLCFFFGFFGFFVDGILVGLP
jgi:hypothetical protein